MLETDLVAVVKGQVSLVPAIGGCASVPHTLRDVHLAYELHCGKAVRDHAECAVRFFRYQALLRHWATRDQPISAMSDPALLAQKLEGARATRNHQLAYDVAERLLTMRPDFLEVAAYQLEAGISLAEKLGWERAERAADRVLALDADRYRYLRETAWLAKTHNLQQARVRRLASTMIATSKDAANGYYLLAQRTQSPALLKEALRHDPANLRATRARDGDWGSFPWNAGAVRTWSFLTSLVR